jgi:hypothetical protein
MIGMSSKFFLPYSKEKLSLIVPSKAAEPYALRAR